jgi:hypothetical protein
VGCCGVNVLKIKGSKLKGRPGALTRGTLRCGGRQGSSLRFDERSGERRAAADGFKQLVIRNTLRISGANPGRLINMVIDLAKFR